MRFKPYPKYKPAGVEWLGEVPEHWEKIPVRLLASNKDSLFIDGDWIESKDLSASGIKYLTTGNVGEGYYKEQGAGYISDEKFHELNCTEIFPGDVLISRLNIPIARACLAPQVDERMVGAVDIVILRPDEQISSKFLVYVMSSKEHFANTENLARGTTMQRISRGTLGGIRVYLPSYGEQSAIATFLDRETAKIDTLIAKQEKLIELLKEKRQAIISHAVTNGLNPNAKMKDSGIEWLGEVPEHWAVKRLKNISPQITVGIVVEPSKYYVEDGVPALRSLNVQPGRIVTDNLMYISDMDNEALSKSKLHAGDLVAVRSGQPGTTAVVPQELDGCNCIDLIIIRKPTFGSEHFLCWYLGSDAATYQFSEGSGGAIQQHFNIGSAVNLTIPVPPAEEQITIITFLDRETTKIDTLIAKAEQAIALQREHRTVLISAAVTGKIDVREAA